MENRLMDSAEGKEGEHEMDGESTWKVTIPYVK